MTLPGGSGIEALVERAPTRPMRRRLFRCVPALSYITSPRPTFLHTSGRPGRCNPAGVDCLYFSETEEVALREYKHAMAGTGREEAPKLTFVAEVDLRQILDLAKPEALTALELAGNELLTPWRGSPTMTRLQALGLAVSRQQAVSAIRYPSAVARELPHAGWNCAIFPSSLALPSRLRILGEGGKSLEELP